MPHTAKNNRVSDGHEMKARLCQAWSMYRFHVLNDSALRNNFDHTTSLVEHRHSMHTGTTHGRAQCLHHLASAPPPPKL